MIWWIPLYMFSSIIPTAALGRRAIPEVAMERSSTTWWEQSGCSTQTKALGFWQVPMLQVGSESECGCCLCLTPWAGWGFIDGDAGCKDIFLWSPEHPDHGDLLREAIPPSRSFQNVGLKYVEISFSRWLTPKLSFSWPDVSTALSIRPIWCYHLVVAEACETLCVTTAMLETADVAVNMWPSWMNIQNYQRFLHPTAMARGKPPNYWIGGGLRTSCGRRPSGDIIWFPRS